MRARKVARCSGLFCVKAETHQAQQDTQTHAEVFGKHTLYLLEFEKPFNEMISQVPQKPLADKADRPVRSPPRERTIKQTALAVISPMIIFLKKKLHCRDLGSIVCKRMGL